MRKDFPWIKVEKDFLTKEECRSLTEYITNHELVDQSDLSDSFSSSYGFTIKFNMYSKYDFIRSKYNLKRLYDIFERIKEPGTNAYICNPLILEKSTTIGYHYDDTLGIGNPVCVTVIYLDLPSDMTGGEFCMRDHSHTFVEPPEIGKKLTFRGDMCHMVRPYETNENKRRVSLVFEQYKLPEIDLCKGSTTLRTKTMGKFLP
jgi:hypothetical protein